MMSTNALRNKILSIFVIISFILSSNLGYADALRAPLGREAQRLKQALLEKLEERIKTAKLVIIDFDKVLTLDKKLIPTLDIVQSLLQADESLKICLISSGNDIPIRELLSLWPIRYAKLVDFLESGRFILRKDITGDKKDAVVDVAKKTKIAETATVIISESKQMEQALGNSLFIAVDDTDNYNMLSTDGVLRHMLNTKNPAYLKFDIDLAGIMRAPVIDFTGLTELVDANDFLITSIRASYYRELIRLGVPQERAMQIAKGIIRSRLNEDREMMAVAGLLKGRAGLCMKIGGTSFKSGIVDENGALSSIGESKFWEKIAGKIANELTVEEITAKVVEDLAERLSVNPALINQEKILIGISMPGQTENESGWGRIAGAGSKTPNMPFHDTPFAEMIETGLKEKGYEVIVMLINDSYAGTLGELSVNGTLGALGQNSGAFAIGGTGVNVSMAVNMGIVTDGGALRELGNVLTARRPYDFAVGEVINHAYEWLGSFPPDPELEAMRLQRFEVLINGQGLSELASLFGFSIPGHDNDLPEATHSALQGNAKALKLIEVYASIVGRGLASIAAEREGYRKPWAENTVLGSSIFEKFAFGVRVPEDRMPRIQAPCLVEAKATDVSL